MVYLESQNAPLRTVCFQVKRQSSKTLTGVQLGSLSAGNDGPHTWLRGHSSHRVNLERKPNSSVGLNDPFAAGTLQ